MRYRANKKVSRWRCDADADADADANADANRIRTKNNMSTSLSVGDINSNSLSFKNFRFSNPVPPNYQYYLSKLPRDFFAIGRLFLWTGTLFLRLRAQGYIKPTEERFKIELVLSSWWENRIFCQYFPACSKFDTTGDEICVWRIIVGLCDGIKRHVWHKLLPYYSVQWPTAPVVWNV